MEFDECFVVVVLRLCLDFVCFLVRFVLFVEVCGVWCFCPVDDGVEVVEFLDVDVTMWFDSGLLFVLCI